MNDKVITTSAAHIWLRPDNIIQIEYLPNTAITLAKIKEVIQAAHILSDYQKKLIFNDIRGVKSLDHDARTYAAAPESHIYVLAMALLVDSPLSRLLGNFYLNFSKPPAPTRLFTKEQEAITWLKTFITHL